VALPLALGAVRASVLRQFLFEGLRIVGVGCLAGLGLTIASARLITGMLYGVSPNDPMSLAVVLVAVVTISAAAALIPAFRASRVDAMVVLRDC
jgi:putative ABC transport system permease protein